jgi:hypothetical protein
MQRDLGADHVGDPSVNLQIFSSRRIAAAGLCASARLRRAAPSVSALPPLHFVLRQGKSRRSTFPALCAGQDFLVGESAARFTYYS